MLVAGTGVYLAGQTSLLYALLSSWLVWLYLGGTTWLYLAYHTIGRYTWPTTPLEHLAVPGIPHHRYWYTWLYLAYHTIGAHGLPHHKYRYTWPTIP